MKLNNVAGLKNIDAFVDYKIKLLEQSDKSMEALFNLMFSERENVFFEQSEGIKTTKITYGQACDKILSLASDLQRKVCAEPQSVVGLYMQNSADWIVAFWTIVRAGFKPLLLNTRFADSAVEQVLRQAKAVSVVSDGKLFSVPTIAFDTVLSGEPLSGGEFGEEFFVLSSGTSAVIICAYSANELVQTIYNSRAVLKQNKQIKSHYNGQLKLLTFLPFYHIFGFVALYVWFAFFSRTFVLLKDFDGQTILNTIKRHRVTHIFAVPLFWNTVYKQAIASVKARGEKTWKKFNKGMAIADNLGNSALGRAFSKKAFAEVRKNLFGDSVRFMISGGSCIDGKVLRFFNNVGYTLANGYGMSEIGITSVELSSKRKNLIDCSVGKPFPSVSYKIEGGKLLVKGSSCCKYILQNGQTTVLGGDWYDTQDLAQSCGGRYYIGGRSDDLIVSVTGENINPIDEENRLAIDGVELCLVSGGSKLPVLVAGIDEFADDDRIENVKTQLKLKIEQNNLSAQVGKIVVVKGSLIAENEFKLNRKRIARQYADMSEENARLQTVASTDALTSFVRQSFANVLNKPVQSVGLDSDFFSDEGGTSLDYFALVSELQKKFPLPFVSAEGQSLKTVKEFVDYIRATGEV